jgi:hypothetical protein
MGLNATGNVVVVLAPRSVMEVVGEAVFGGDAILKINNGGNMTVDGNVVLGPNTTVSVQQNPTNTAMFNVSGNIAFDGGVEVEVQDLEPFGPCTTVVQTFAPGRRVLNERATVIEATTPRPALPADAPRTTINVNVANYGDSNGVLNSAALEQTYPCSRCDVPISDSQAVYGGSTLSVTLSVGRDTTKEGCEVFINGISAGVVAGIVVGLTVFCAIVATILIIVLRKRELQNKKKLFASKMTSKLGDDLKK